MDARALEAQSLYWQVYGGVNLSQAEREATLARMAQLHEEIATERLAQNDSLGWSDYYAAVTAWGEADHLQEARSLLHRALRSVDDFPAIRQQVIHELEELRCWLDQREASGWNQSDLFFENTEIVRLNLSRHGDRLALVG